MERQNITLALPKDVLKQARHLAVERGVSLSSMLSEFLTRIVQDDEDYRAAARRIRSQLKNATDLGTGGVATWTREELHERTESTPAPRRRAKQG